MGELKDSEILANVIKSCGETPNSFGKKLKYRSPATIYHVLNEINNLSPTMIDRIINTFPNVNYSYLKDGKGEIFLKGNDLINQKNLFNIEEEPEKLPTIQELLSIPNKLEQIIELLEVQNDLLKKSLE